MNIFEEKIILESGNLMLRPLSMEDIPGLSSIAFNADIWKFYPTRITNEEELSNLVEQMIIQRARNERIPFTISDKEGNSIMGSTSYLNISVKDKRLEIGSTWLGKKYQGTGVNKICKFLLLRFAFEKLSYDRVELKADVLNMQSRKAMLKIGAVEEGILRSHTLMHDGRRRDTIYYSILKNEWEDIKKNIFAEFC
ncbi:MAG: GNAT family protein [Ignavibacteriaceae bacterium]|nr:GNAT family protein [Ignavibacteriaceae bacterium]